MLAESLHLATGTKEPFRKNRTITGDLGSGKSTVAGLLAKRLEMDVVETGELYRKYAEQKRIDVLQQNASDDWSIDEKIDSTIKQMGEEKDGIIFVSRLAWYFVPDVIKVYLIINPILAAERIFKAKGRVGESHHSVEEVVEYNRKRKELELSRYSEMYGIADARGYDEADIIVVVGNNSPEDVASCIYAAIMNKEYGFYIDPRVLIPTQYICDFNTYTLNNSRSKHKPALISTAGIDISRCNDVYVLMDGLPDVVACILNGVNFILTDRPYYEDVILNMEYVNRYEDRVSIDLSREVKTFQTSVVND